MLLTNGKMLESLGILANIEEPGKLGYACARNRRILLTECKEFMDKRDELLAKYPKAVKRLQAGRTIREVAGECGLSTKTVQKIKNALK